MCIRDSSGFKKEFLKEFKEQKDSSCLFLSVLFISKKLGFWESVFELKFLYHFWCFPKSFSLIKTLSFSTLELIFYPNLLGSCFVEKRDCLWLKEITCCKPSFICVSLFGKG